MNSHLFRLRVPLQIRRQILFETKQARKNWSFQGRCISWLLQKVSFPNNEL